MSMSEAIRNVTEILGGEVIADSDLPSVKAVHRGNLVRVVRSKPGNGFIIATPAGEREVHKSRLYFITGPKA